MKQLKVMPAFAASIAALTLILFGGRALAVPIVPGGVQFPAVAEPDPVAATLLTSSGPVAFTAATFAGSLVSNVYSNDASNPFGPTGLTFTYQITNNALSAHDIA